MNKVSIEETPYELIKAHIIDPGNSPLSEQRQEQLNRIMTAVKIMDKNPIRKNAFNLLHQKYPHLGKTQLYEDLKLATRLYNTVHEFDWDFYRCWMINDIMDNILTCKKTKTDIGRRIIAMEHANMIRVIGQKPEEAEDPNRSEKHQYYILIQHNHQEVKIELEQLEKLPDATIREINRIIYGGDEISETDAAEMIQS
jgi:hypothetical protein